MNWLDSIVRKKERLVVGLMSGTSIDGVDAALVRIKGSGMETEVELIEFLCMPYSPAIVKRLGEIESSGTIRDVCELNFLIGNAFSKAALEVIKKAGLSVGEVDLIGSHGQTVYHNPPSYGKGIPSTLQLGEADVIAECTGITTVADFRTRDVAAGGEGAPLVSYVDYILFREPGSVRIAQNIGGIANATVITERVEDVLAFDTGPGNALMDGLLIAATGGRKRYDREGKIASKGRVNRELLKKLLEHPYFVKPLPKSTGREVFGMQKVGQLYKMVKSGRVLLEDMMRTLLEFTVESIALSYEQFVFSRWRVKEVILSGGGARNLFLLERLRKRLSPLELSLSDNYGIPVEAKEAVAFAVLANELVSGNAANIPSATGAKRRVFLGKISIGVGAGNL